MSRNKKGLELIESIQEYSLDVKNREIYLAGEVDAELEPPDVEPGVEYVMANKFIKNLRFLSSNSKDPILIHMKTCGGYWEEGMAIYDAIQFCPCFVVILSYTHARSMSSVILQAADSRVLMPNSYVLMHHGGLGFDGEYQKVMAQMEWTKKVQSETMVNIYADRMKRTPHSKYKKWGPKRIKDMLMGEMAKKIDVFLTADEAVSWGLADAVFDGNWADLKSGQLKTEVIE
jgi:ATP-dependent protease ClpP protease subunit